MIRSQIVSRIDLMVLQFMRRFIGKNVEIDKDVAIPLGISHDLLCRTIRHLRSAGYLSYKFVYASDRRRLYCISWVSEVKAAEQDPEQLTFDFMRGKR